MDSRTIEMRLRLPAPDEPAELPPLLLPAFGRDLGRVTPSVRMQRGRAAPGNPRLVFAVTLLALATAGIVLAGALRLLNDRVTPVNQLEWPPAVGVLGIQDRFTMSWPEGWVRLAEGGLSQGDFTQVGIAYERVAIILASTSLSGCPSPLTTAGPNVLPSGDAPAPVNPRGFDPAVGCLRSAHLPPSAVRVTVEVGQRSRGLVAASGPALLDTSEPTRESGWTEVIDGQPARLTVATGPEAEAVGALESRTWDVIFPGTIDHLLRIRVDIAGPDPADGLDDAQAVIDSIDFAADPQELDPSTANATLVRLIDELDRSARQSRSDFYACFPREPGTAEGTISATPGEQLPAPVRVACTTSIVPSVVGVWRITLTAKWPAGDGYPAGGHAQEFYAQGNGGGWGDSANVSYPLDAAGNPQRDSPVWFPQGPRGLPPPLDGPLGLAPGSFAELLWPGIYPADSPAEISTDQAPGYVGWRVYVMSMHMIEGVEWYAIQWEEGPWQATSKWVPAIRDGRPTMAAVDPACPTGDIDLDAVARLTMAERLACFGSRELTLEHLIATPSDWGGAQCFGADFNPTPCPDAANVDWLEADATYVLWGERGPDGPGLPLPIWVEPSLDGTVPLDQRFRVTGHFDDDFALECRHDPTGSTIHNETAIQALVLGCRERFVVTGFEVTDAP